MLLSSPSFSSFLDQLSSNPALLPQASATETQQQVQPEPTAAPRQMPKDVNPNSFRAGSSQQSQQQIGLAMIPEQSLDLSSLGLGNDSLLNTGFSFTPQVFTAVIETPDLAEVLGGKSSNFVGPVDEETDLYSEDDGKVAFSSPFDDEKTVEVPAPVVAPTEVDDGSDLFDDVEEEEAVAAPAQAAFRGITSEKPTADRIQLTVAEDKPAVEENADVVADKAMRRVERMVSRLENLTRRFEDLADL